MLFLDFSSPDMYSPIFSYCKRRCEELGKSCAPSAAWKNQALVGQLTAPESSMFLNSWYPSKRSWVASIPFLHIATSEDPFTSQSLATTEVPQFHFLCFLDSKVPVPTPLLCCRLNRFSATLILWLTSISTIFWIWGTSLFSLELWRTSKEPASVSALLYSSIRVVAWIFNLIPHSANC